MKIWKHRINCLRRRWREVEGENLFGHCPKKVLVFIFNLLENKCFGVEFRLAWDIDYVCKEMRVVNRQSGYRTTHSFSTEWLQDSPQICRLKTFICKYSVSLQGTIKGFVPARTVTKQRVTFVLGTLFYTTQYHSWFFAEVLGANFSPKIFFSHCIFKRIFSFFVGK